MNRVAFGSLALVVVGISIVMLAPSSDEWRLSGLFAIVVGASVLAGLFMFRVLRDGKGENIFAEMFGDNADGPDH